MKRTKKANLTHQATGQPGKTTLRRSRYANMKQVSSQKRPQDPTLQANASKTIAAQQPKCIRYRVLRCPHLAAGGNIDLNNYLENKVRKASWA